MNDQAKEWEETRKSDYLGTKFKLLPPGKNATEQGIILSWRLHYYGGSVGLDTRVWARINARSCFILVIQTQGLIVSNPALFRLG